MSATHDADLAAEESHVDHNLRRRVILAVIAIYIICAAWAAWSFF